MTKMISRSEMMPLYEQVIAHICDIVADDPMRHGGRIPSENQLVQELGVSRMTVNRAINSLVKDGVLTRKAGVGTFIAPARNHAGPLGLYDIADEAQRRGYAYRAQLLLNEAIVPDLDQCAAFGQSRLTRLFHTQILHFENDVPIQFEDRLVDPAAAPSYLEELMSECNPARYLHRILPRQRSDLVVRALLPPAPVRVALLMTDNEPSLAVEGQTRMGDVVASVWTLYYPGARYEISGTFS